MKGLELSEKYYNRFGRPMLEAEFGGILDRIAVGLAGSGSECSGFDDDISEDHDFEPGFCIFLPDEETVDRRTAFLLERAYAKLPGEFEGYKRNIISPVGGNRHGVFRTADFFKEKAGAADGILTVEQWLTTPEHFLYEAVNGRIFHDGYGEVTEIRERLSYLPEDIRLKKLAGNILTMAQSGQYNYPRCISRSETGAAQLAAIKFAEAAMKTVFLLNRKYMPYYKWSFRAMRELPVFPQLADTVEYLISTDNGEPDIKLSVMDDTGVFILSELQNQKLTDAVCTALEKHAYSVNDRISDPFIRNLNIFAAV